MGPVTIAVDSYGPVTDNAQSIYELSLIEEVPNIEKEIEKDFGFKPDFEKGKYYLEANDGAGNTFKATAKPVLIGTAVVGSTIMIFSIILVIQSVLGVDPTTILNMLNPYTILGLIAGGAVIYWFTGASNQAVTTGAYRAVQFIKKNINLDEHLIRRRTWKLQRSCKNMYTICPERYDQHLYRNFPPSHWHLLVYLLPRAGTNRCLFISYLIAIAVFGLFQAVFMANAGGAWDNAKKVVEVDLKKRDPLHEASVVGDTVGDPFKDTSSVALNPIIKFTTLFGLLAMEISIQKHQTCSTLLGSYSWPLH
jgi:K(+)-stimulated pyrophosphate-energized sodium pump